MILDRIEYDYITQIKVLYSQLKRLAEILTFPHPILFFCYLYNNVDLFLSEKINY
jgi:hypothetical protein